MEVPWMGEVNSAHLCSLLYHERLYFELRQRFTRAGRDRGRHHRVQRTHRTSRVCQSLIPSLFRCLTTYQTQRLAKRCRCRLRHASKVLHSRIPHSRWLATYRTQRLAKPCRWRLSHRAIWLVDGAAKQVQLLVPRLQVQEVFGAESGSEPERVERVAVFAWWLATELVPIVQGMRRISHVGVGEEISLGVQPRHLLQEARKVPLRRCSQTLQSSLILFLHSEWKLIDKVDTRKPNIYWVVWSENCFSCSGA